MSDTYAILGYADNLDGPVVLYESDSYTQCEQWRDDYTRWGDWDGYDCLALYEIAPHQSVTTIHLHDMHTIAWHIDGSWS
jgi:hypothetical protein